MSLQFTSPLEVLIAVTSPVTETLPLPVRILFTVPSIFISIDGSLRSSLNFPST